MKNKPKPRLRRASERGSYPTRARLLRITRDIDPELLKEEQNMLLGYKNNGANKLNS